MSEFPAVSHVALTVSDLGVSAPWYERLLGVGPVIDEDVGAFRHVVYPLAGGMLVGLHEHPATNGEARFDELRIGLDHVAFACADRGELEAWQARLDRLGIAHAEIVDAAYGSGLSFRDPDNIALEFFAPPSGGGTGMGPVTVAAVQAAPVFLDRDATIDKAVRLIKEAASDGAQLVAFPEAFVPAYPDWVWRTRPWTDGPARWYERLLDQAVKVPSPATERLGKAARTAGCYVSIGVNELAGATLYNTQLWLSPGGDVLGAHRKLMPTGGERLVWGFGDGSTMPVFDTPIGRLGGLICWENYMPLARYALYDQGIDIHVAPTWDNSDMWVPTMRHIAKEGRMHVVGVTFCLRASDIPADIPGRDEIYGDDEWLARGNSCVVGPDGDLLAGPLEAAEGIVPAEIDLDRARASRRQFDPVGHYARPDVFRLHVDRRPTPAVARPQFRADGADADAGLDR